MKLSHILFLTATLFLTTQVEAQEAYFLTDNGIFKRDSVFVKDQYAVVMSTRQRGAKPDISVEYFKADRSLVWKKVIPTQYNVMRQRNRVIASPDGNTIYAIHQNEYGFYKEVIYITVLTRSGEEKKFEIEGREEFGKKLLHIFCDNQYLYFLASDDGNELSDKKKASEKLILNRFQKDNFSYKRIVLNLPAIAEGEESTFWAFIGQQGEEKFLASKFIDVEGGRNKFTVVTINPEGVVNKTMVMETRLENGVFARPSRASYTGLGFNSAKEIVDLSFSPTESGKSINTHTSAFGELSYNTEHDCFYAYGLVGPERFKKTGVVIYEGFYTYKFSRQGDLVWKVQVPGGELLSEKFYRKQGYPEHRWLKIIPLTDGSLQVNISCTFVDDRYSSRIVNGSTVELPMRLSESPAKK